MGTQSMLRFEGSEVEDDNAAIRSGSDEDVGDRIELELGDE